ncbi:hypothetical protein IFU33_22800 (plasmid) [Pantoea agglomerans]|uniref:hypothetical protein n=1 Tax=Enterobacter agglomerans TaxID=549 RepID=UPI0017846FD2|nr:hypothetical protein [Pantoea agglomerans]WLO87345.1 hypothetical protein NHB29_23105 [Pantoea agglomerans]WVJ49102.1 hypothetical protein IFU33_22800 [Pantoea agglomerans]
MSILGRRYLARLKAATSQSEFDINALDIIDSLQTKIRYKDLTEEQVNEIIDEIIKGLFEAGFEKKGLGLEQQGYESLSIDNSKTDELLAMALAPPHNQSAQKMKSSKPGK